MQRDMAFRQRIFHEPAPGVVLGQTGARARLALCWLAIVLSAWLNSSARSRAQDAPPEAQAKPNAPASEPSTKVPAAGAPKTRAPVAEPKHAEPTAPGTAPDNGEPTAPGEPAAPAEVPPSASDTPVESQPGTPVPENAAPGAQPENDVETQAEAEASESKGPVVPETICEGKRISRIEIKGYGRVAADDIRSTIKLREGLPCTDAEVTRDAEALWDMGYFRDLRVSGDVAGDEIVLTFELTERPAIGEIIYTGNDAIETSDIEQKVTLKTGGILSMPELRTQVDKIRDLYAEKGYFLAKVHYELKSRPNNEVQVNFVIEEGAAVSVRRIHFVGNDHLSESELRSVIQTSQTNVLSFITSSDKYKREIFDEDVNRLHALYYDYGYLTVELDEPRLELTADRRYLDVTIPLKEGPRFRVGRVRVLELDEQGQEIEPLAGRKKLRENVELNPGDWFSRSTIAKNLQDITREYRDLGYAKVEVAPDTALHMDKHVVDLAVTVRRGPLVYVERINIKGNTKTRDAVLRREARIVEGQLYSQTLVERSKERMTALGYFQGVTVAEENGSGPDKIIINFEVTEKPTGTFQLGAGFSSQETFLLNGQIQQENLFGRGQSLALNLQFSGIRQLAQLRFIEPYLFSTTWSSSVELFRIQQQRRDFNRNSTGGSLTVGHPLSFLSDDLRLFVTYRLEFVDITPATGGLLGVGGTGLNYRLFSFVPLRNLFNSGQTSSVRLSLTFDTRNNRLFPTSGIFTTLSTEVSDEYIGSSNSFMRNEFNFRAYQPIWGPFVFKLNTQWGLITSRSGRGVPIYERYFLGGILDMRGFPLMSLGPRLAIPTNFRDPTFQTVTSRGTTYGGNFEAYTNFEIEFPIVESVGIKGVLFTDVGNTWNLEKSLCGPAPATGDTTIQPCGVDLTSLRYALGFGFRWFSPLGPLRFEWGFPINPRRPYEDTYEFQFTVGNAF